MISLQAARRNILVMGEWAQAPYRTGVLTFEEIMLGSAQVTLCTGINQAERPFMHRSTDNIRK